MSSVSPWRRWARNMLFAVVVVLAELWGLAVARAGVGPLAPTEPTFHLTEDERAYLLRKKALTYCIDPDWAPVERLDENGRHVGITADFLQRVGARLGVPLVLVPTSSWSRTVAAVREHRCDFLPAARPTPARRQFLDFTTPYLRFPVLVVTRAKAGLLDASGRFDGQSLGVINGYAVLDLLQAKYPHLHLREVTNVAQGLKLVSEGKLDGYADIEPAIKQALARETFDDLRIAGRLDVQLALSVATRRDEPELHTLFQQAVDSLPPERITGIVHKWLTAPVPGADGAGCWGRVLAGFAVGVVLVFWWRRWLVARKRERQRDRAALDAANRRLEAVLADAGRCLLTVDAAGVVDAQCSRQCRVLFGGDIAGANLPALLYPEDAVAREGLAQNIRRVLSPDDEPGRELHLALLPKLVRRRNVTVRVSARLLSEDRVLFVLTDDSCEERLRETIARERDRLHCLGAVVRNQGNFFRLLDEFAALRREAVRPADGPIRAESFARSVYLLRERFLEFACDRTARALDDLETRLAEARQGTPSDVAALAARLADKRVDRALDEDLDVIREALGKTFFERRGQVAVSGRLADELADLASRLLAGTGEGVWSQADVAVLHAAAALRFCDVRERLSVYPRLAMRQARRQGKVLVGFSIEGDRVLVDPRRFDPLLQSLGHVFRNAVDHGVEMPSERALAGKPEAGRLLCRVRRLGETLGIEVLDDGRGVDVAAVRARAYELGVAGAEALAIMTESELFELLFRDGFSTRRRTGAGAGRGLGLAAVRTAVVRLHGTVKLENLSGGGARVRVLVPLSSEERQLRGAAADRVPNDPAGTSG